MKITEILQDPRITALMKKPTRPDLEALRPLFEDYKVDSVPRLWQFMEAVEHAWADYNSTEEDWYY